MLNLGAVWGIDIGEAALKAVKLKRVGSQVVLQDFQVIRYAEVTGDPSARRDDALAEAIAALQGAGMGRDRCMVSIAPQTVFSRFISLPPVDRRRVPEIVLYEARQQIPFSLSEVIWSYETVRKEFIPGEEIEIGLFAVKREVVEAYLAELRPLWRQIHGIQIAPLALYNFIRYDVALDKPTVIMDVGSQSTDLIIVEGEKFWLRNLPIAGNSFTSVLEKRLNIPRAEAEKLKCGMAGSRHRRKLLEVLRPVMRDLVAEVQRSIGYYKSLSQDVKLEDVLVVGEGYKLFGLDRFLMDQLQYSVTTVDQLANVAYQGPPERVEALREAIPTLCVATGLALQGLGRARTMVNLLPDDFVIQREMHGKRFNGLIAAGLVWAIVGCLCLSESRGLGQIEQVLDDGRATLKAVDDLKKELSKVRGADVQKKIKMFDDVGTHRQYYARIIGAIAEVVPRSIDVDRFEFTLVKESRETRRGGGPEAGSVGTRGDRRERKGQKRALSKDEKGVRGAKLLLSFQASCEASREHVELTEKLPRALKRARTFPEEIALVKGVAIGDIRRVAGEGRRAQPGAVRGRRGEARAEQTDQRLTAEVRVALVPPEEIDAARAKAAKTAKAARDREEAERKKAEEEAAALSASRTRQAGVAEKAAESGPEG